MRDKVVVEDNEITEEEAKRIWAARVKEAENAVKEAKMFISKHKLRDKPILFIGALTELLSGVLNKKR